MVASAAADMLQSGTTGLRFSPNDGSEHLLQCGSLTRNQTLCKLIVSWREAFSRVPLELERTYLSYSMPLCEKKLSWLVAHATLV